MSASRSAALQQAAPIGRYSPSPTMIIAAFSESTRSHGQPSLPVTTARSGHPFGTTCVCTSTTGPVTETATGCQPFPGCSVPHVPQVRASSLS